MEVVERKCFLCSHVTQGSGETTHSIYMDGHRGMLRDGQQWMVLIILSDKGAAIVSVVEVQKQVARCAKTLLKSLEVQYWNDTALALRCGFAV